MDKYEHAKFIIERFDHYCDSVNNKGAFYIALNTFIFGGICVGYITLHDKVEETLVIWILLSALMLSNILSLGFTVWAIMPFLKDSNFGEQAPSLIFFGGIARHQSSHFKEKLLSLDDNAILEDTVQQAYCLAICLDGKYKKLRWSSRFVIVQFIVMVPLLLLIVNNLK